MTATTISKQRRRTRRTTTTRRRARFFDKTVFFLSASFLLLFLSFVATVINIADFHNVAFVNAQIPVAIEPFDLDEDEDEADKDVDEDSSNPSIGTNPTIDGPKSLREGARLFEDQDYAAASTQLWRAILVHPEGDNEKIYRVDKAFELFLKCYVAEHRVVDGLVFVAAEGYLRGQDDMGDMYLHQALERGSDHPGALELQRIRKEAKEDAEGTQQGERLLRLRKVRDEANLDNGSNASNMKAHVINPYTGEEINTDYNKNKQRQHNYQRMDVKRAFHEIKDKSPEEMYDLATLLFNAKNLKTAAHVFELSCQQSDMKLAPACVNAVYLRTNLCEWGYRGEGFERDMILIEEVTRAEAKAFRMVTKNATEELRRQNGLGVGSSNGVSDGEGVIQWKRSTSVHPHMMLGFPLSNENAILKRYASESMASMDELRARAEDDGTIPPKPIDLPYNVSEMHAKFVQKHQREEKRIAETNDLIDRFNPVKVGFVACSFNSKAVLYLSHDMFRYFNPEIVEIHIFSTGPPDHPHFITHVMRGVDWRQRVEDAVDRFHDVRAFQNDHVGLARYIRSKDIQILVEWDGYARQGERAAGLMALRPAPVQILHQEFLMTSGAQYFDYIVTDKVTSPLENEHLYTEKFLYLPHHFFSKGHGVQEEVLPPMLEYVPKKDRGAKFALGVGTPQENACLSANPLGIRNNEERREVSFVYCNFNKFLKNNPQTMQSWIRILKEVPDSILCLLENPAEGTHNIHKFVAETTRSADYNNRIHFLPWEKNPFDHQRRSFSLCNAMLDSHPYNGHTTAQDALYAGVPVVTRSDGVDMSSRVSTSANVVLGLEELNAYGGSREYEDIAIRLGKDESWFRSIRTKLVETCLQKEPMHPYWDVMRYVENFQTGLKTIWHNFLEGKAMDHIEVVEEDGHVGTMEAEAAKREKYRRSKKVVSKYNLKVTIPDKKEVEPKDEL